MNKVTRYIVGLDALRIRARIFVRHFIEHTMSYIFTLNNHNPQVVTSKSSQASITAGVPTMKPGGYRPSDITVHTRQKDDSSSITLTD